MILLRSTRAWIAGLIAAINSTRLRAMAAIQGEWSVVLIGTLMISSLSYTIEKAEWVSNNEPIVSALFLGWFFGLLLAYSRNSALFAVFYSALVSIFFTANRLGSITPPLLDWFREPLWLTVERLHLRLVTFALRVSGWFATLQIGDSVRDTDLFVWILSLLGWISLSWLAWWVVRRNQAMTGLVPLTFLMAVNVHLSQQIRSSLAVFLGFGLLLIARSAYTARRDDWKRRRVDSPEDIAIDWGGWTLLIASLIAIFALLTPFIGTKEGWQAVSDWVQRSRVEMAERADQLFGGVKPPPPGPDDELVERIPSIALPDLGDIGRPPPTGNETVFWVGVSDPAPLPEEILQGRPPETELEIPKHNWRSRIFSTYTGRGWEPEPPGAVLTEVLPPEEYPLVIDTPGRYRLTQIFEIHAIHSGLLFSANQPVAVSEDYFLRRAASDDSALVEGSGQSYRVISLATRVTVAELEAAPVEVPAEIRSTYLQLPAGLPKRVERLAREIAGSASSPYQKAARVQDYLRLNYTYDLETPAAPFGRDVVDYFLFDGGRGYCSHYASAMAVMLRALEVPARVVTGYAMGNYDQGRAMYRVPVSFAHAWVEVYFPGYGWIEFEPTSAYSAFTYLPGEAPLPASLANPIPAAPSSIGARGRGGWLVLLLFIPVGLWGLYFWSRAQKRRTVDTVRLAVQLYERIRLGLAWGGLPSTASLTPDEYLDQGKAHLSEYPRLGTALERATRLYCSAEYSPRPPALVDVRRAEAAWQQARQEWLRMIFNR